MSSSASIDIEAILGADAPELLQHECKTIPQSTLHLPAPDHIEQIWLASDRPIRVLTSLQSPARPRAPRRHGLRVDPAGGPGD